MAGVQNTIQTPDANAFMPSNIVPTKEKEFDVWARNWVDFIINYGQYCFTGRDAANQNAALGIVNPTDYSHITDIFTKPETGDSKSGTSKLAKSFPAKLRNINVIASMVNKGVGRVEGEGFDFSAYLVNEEAVTKKLQDFSIDTADHITRHARQQSGIAQMIGQPLVEGDDVQPENPEVIRQKKFLTFQQEEEKYITWGLEYLLTKNSLFLKHKLIEQGLRSFWATGKMAFDTLVENDPNLQFIPPQQLIYELASNNPFLQFSRYCGYFWYGTPQAIIERCPELTKAQITTINTEFGQLQSNNSQGGGSSTWYRFDAPLNTFMFTPYKVYWCADKKEKVRIRPNPTDEDNPNIDFIGECYDCDGSGKFTKPNGKKVYCTRCKGTGEGVIRDDGTTGAAQLSEGDKIEYRYFKTWFEGQKLGSSVYYQLREIPGQHRSQDEPEIVEGPLVGVVDPNPCPVDLVLPLQELRTECWFTIERMLGQMKIGNVLVVDEAGGQDVWGANYNMINFGIYTWDSSLEGNNREKPQAPVVKDIGASSALTEIMRFIGFIDANIALVSGDNDASRGVVKSDQGLGITQNALQQAQFTLQPYYAIYYTTVKMVLQRLIDLMPRAWAGRNKISFFMGDEGAKLIQMSAEMWEKPADYGLFLRNSVQATEAKKYMIQAGMAWMAHSPDPNTALSVLEMIGAKSDAECKEIFKRGVDAINKAKAIADEQQAKNQQAALQQKDAADKQDAAVESEKAKSPKEVAMINAQTKMALEDKKQTHKEDVMTVEFKNDIAKMVAEMMKEQQMNSDKPQEQAGPQQ